MSDRTPENIKRTYNAATGKEYGIERYNLFVKEAEEAGYEVEFYQGRFNYSGPAVRVKDEDDYIEFVRHTTVPIQWDNMGKTGRIVYPK